MYAVDDLSDAIDVTKNFLTPITAGKWLRLAIVVLFIGGVSGGNFTFPGGGGGGEAPPMDPVSDPSIPSDVLLLVAGIVTVILLVTLFFMTIGAILEFVFVESLRTGEVHVRRYGKSNLRNALSLLLFRIGLGLAMLLAIGLPVGAVYLAAPGFEAFTFGVVAVLGLFAVAVFLVQSVVSHLTTNFVVPIMLLESGGVIEGWRRFWPTLAGEWKEYVVYYLLAWFLGLVVGIGVGFLSLLVAIPFGLVGFVLAITVVGLILVPVIVLLFLLVVGLIQVPVVSYFRYYALLVLGDTNADLDLIPNQRAAVRSDGGAGRGRTGSSERREEFERDEPARGDRRFDADEREGGSDDRVGDSSDRTDDSDGWDGDSSERDGDDDRWGGDDDRNDRWGGDDDRNDRWGGDDDRNDR